MWESTAVATLALGGITIAAAAGSLPSRGSLRGDGGPHLAVRAAVLFLAALVAVAVEVPGIVSTERVRASQEAARAGDLEASAALAEEAGECGALVRDPARAIGPRAGGPGPSRGRKARDPRGDQEGARQLALSPGARQDRAAGRPPRGGEAHFRGRPPAATALALVLTPVPTRASDLRFSSRCRRASGHALEATHRFETTHKIQPARP